MKKLFLLLLALVVVISLCACGKDKNPAPSGSGESSTVEPTNNESASNDKTRVETDPYNAQVTNAVIQAYLDKAAEVEKNHKAEQAGMIDNNPDFDISSLRNLQYDLVFFDEDDIPELIVTDLGYRVAMYTYDGEKAVYTMVDEYDDGAERGWSYGVGGNAGYDYIPRGNVIRNFSTAFAGLIRYVSYSKLDNASKQLVKINKGDLAACYFVDSNKNGQVDENEYDSYVEEPTMYLIGDKVVSSGDYNAQIIEGDFDELTARKTYADFKTALEGMLTTK